jgi:ferrous-iron efflux pump FieF
MSLNIRAGIASATVATLLVALKIYASWSTGSAAMLGSLADSGLDLIASLVTLYSVRLAAMPADRQHRFGHGKAEAIAALLQVVLISLSAFWLAVHSAGALFAGTRSTGAGTGVAVSVISMILTLALINYQRSVIARTGSLAIGTDSVHYQSDFALNAAVIAALLLDQLADIRGADAVAGLGIALWLLHNAYAASQNAVDQLMDREWPEARRHAFIEVANRHPELRGIHDLRTRTSGNNDFVQFHVWVDPDMTVGEAHRVMDEVEARLRDVFPDVEILIHPDPAGRAGDEQEGHA